MKLETKDMREMYSLLTDQEKEIVYALAIKKAISREITHHDVICLFVAEKIKSGASCENLSQEVCASLHKFMNILQMSKSI